MGDKQNKIVPIALIVVFFHGNQKYLLHFEEGGKEQNFLVIGMSIIWLGLASKYSEYVVLKKWGVGGQRQ